MPTSNGVREYLMSAREKRVNLPSSIQFEGVSFSRTHDDLVLEDKRGDRVFIRGFFAQKKYPLLVSDAGEYMDGDLAAAFVRLSPLAVTALLEIDKEQEGRADSSY